MGVNRACRMLIIKHKPIYQIRLENFTLFFMELPFVWSVLFSFEFSRHTHTNTYVHTICMEKLSHGKFIVANNFLCGKLFSFFALFLWCGNTQQQVKQVAGRNYDWSLLLWICTECTNWMKFSVQRHSWTIPIIYLFPCKLCDVLIVYFFIHLSLQMFYSNINKVIYSERSLICNFITCPISFFLNISSHEMIL